MANTVRCPNGHFFDMNKFRFCPHCGLAAAMPNQQPEMPQPPAPQPFMPMPQPVQQGYMAPPVPPQTLPPQPFMPPVMQQPEADDRVNQTSGWLVCVKGIAKGCAFSLRENKNFIGSAPHMDIALMEEGVAPDKHAIIAYDPKYRQYYALPGEARELYYVNDSAVFGPVALKANDLLEIGSVRLVFIPLCTGEFSWADHPRT